MVAWIQSPFPLATELAQALPMIGEIDIVRSFASGKFLITLMLTVMSLMVPSRRTPPPYGS